MATEWSLLHQQFLNEHAHTGISVKAWCIKKELNYATARRYIKLSKHKSLDKKPDAHNRENIKNAHKEPITISNKQKNQKVKSMPISKETNIDENKNTPPKKRVASLANQNARKFGHYSEFITTNEDAIRFDSASTTTLGDELKLMRMQFSNLIVALKSIEGDLNKDQTQEERIRLYEIYEKFQTVANVKIARIESLDNSIIRQEKTRVDIEKTVALTQKAELEIEKLRSSSSEAQLTLQEIYDDLMANPGNGMLNSY